MSAISSIEWTDRTWNPVRGCSVVSPGCVNCYAMKQAHRFSGKGKPYDGLTKQTSVGPQWTGKVSLVTSALTQPLVWKKPQRIFVNSMSDLFHESVPDEFILNVFTVMAVAKQHRFQVLTKRSARMRELVSSWRADDIYTYWHGYSDGPAEIDAWPLPNVQLGVSCEDQPRADERIPDLLQTPAAVRLVSAEPLIGPINFGFDGPCDHIRQTCEDVGCWRALDWVIVGGESGPCARPCDVAWIRSIVQQCQSVAVPVFVKQLGSIPISAGADVDRMAEYNRGFRPRLRSLHRTKHNDPTAWPHDLRVREFPTVEARA